ncbi:hypothetical protein [Candidatus Methanoliparum sp. LAM-1]|uniref:hypothetical protein n=1 Tax=Candidatus Methanoliparum sp. LAM-1 TaxID=2874846 RepID=UPI001E2B38EB|nr:hypothetical protein [Candidatus Methanoliparum sp. LAM-1]BDC36419.1 hypothetical protein MTLP_11010 [Candidatus Methanoliparum sp. LAM-1]
MRKNLLKCIGCLLMIPSMLLILQSVNAVEIDKIGEKSVYPKIIYIQGEVSPNKIDFYSLEYLRKGAAVTIELDQPKTYGDSAKIRILDRMSPQSDIYPRWTSVYNGQPYQYIVPYSGEYMIQIKGSYPYTGYSGVITIVN